MIREKSDLENKLQQAARNREILQKGVQKLQRELASHIAHPPPPPSNLDVNAGGEFPANMEGATPLHWAPSK